MWVQACAWCWRARPAWPTSGCQCSRSQGVRTDGRASDTTTAGRKQAPLSVLSGVTSSSFLNRTVEAWSQFICCVWPSAYAEPLSSIDALWLSEHKADLVVCDRDYVAGSGGKELLQHDPPAQDLLKKLLFTQVQTARRAGTEQQLQTRVGDGRNLRP